MHKKLKVLLLLLSLQTLHVLPMAYVRNAGRIATRPVTRLMRHCSAHKKLYACAAAVVGAGAYVVRKTLQRQPQQPVGANQSWRQRLYTRVVGWVRPARHPEVRHVLPAGIPVVDIPAGIHPVNVDVDDGEGIDEILKKNGHERQDVECLHTLEGHERPALVVTFNPDGTRLATASTDDGTMRVWQDRKAIARINARRLAFASALYPRLGENSPARELSQDLMKEILKHVR